LKISFSRIGYYVSVSTVILSVITFVVAFFTPPLSGPYCIADCFTYPYSDIGSRFPRDYYWMFPGMLLCLVYVLQIICVYELNQWPRQVIAKLGLICGSSGALILFSNYFIQVSTIPASHAAGELEGIALLSQYNPHGLFIVLEELSYILMGISFLCLSSVFYKDRLERSIRNIFIGSFALTVMAFSYYTLNYGIGREYRFELMAISINWLTLIIGGILLSIVFKRKIKSDIKTN
jgi:hypothetical protein